MPNKTLPVSGNFSRISRISRIDYFGAQNPRRFPAFIYVMPSEYDKARSERAFTINVDQINPAYTSHHMNSGSALAQLCPPHSFIELI